MQGDSLSQFLDQGGGAVLRLILMTVIMGVIWLMAISLVIYRRNERKRREREGRERGTGASIQSAFG